MREIHDRTYVELIRFIQLGNEAVAGVGFVSDY